MQKDERSWKVLKKWVFIFLPMKHKSGHTISTRDFSDKLTSDLISQSYLPSQFQVDFLSCTCYKLLEYKWIDKPYFLVFLNKWVSNICLMKQTTHLIMWSCEGNLKVNMLKVNKGTSKYDDLQPMLLCFLPLWDLPGCILKIGEALGKVLVNPPCFYTDHRWKGYQQGLGLTKKIPVARNKPVLTRMVGVVALSTQQFILPNVWLECGGNVGNQGLYMYFFAFLTTRLVAFH